jgi:hypothetical protein
MGTGGVEQLGRLLSFLEGGATQEEHGIHINPLKTKCV